MVLVFGIIIAVVCNRQNREEAEDASPEIVTVVSDEEYQFYKECVEKEYKGNDLEELEQKTKEYAKEVYAQFGLGAKYGLCKPYSYESLKMDMESENQLRQAKDNAGEVVYGALEYTLDGYLQYTRSNLKIQTVEYLVEHHDANLEEKAKLYWEKHPDKFQRIEKITYRLGDETKTVAWEELPTLEKTDSELFEYLYYGEKGDTFTLSDKEKAVEGELLEKTMKTIGFEEDRSSVLKIYISDVYYEKLLKQAEADYPLEFELNQEQ